MDADLKAKWVAALRSGEYQQTTGALRKEGGYCCLGVLCDVAGATWSRGDPNDRYWIATYNGEREEGVLPGSLARAIFGAYEHQDPRVIVYAGDRNHKTTLSVLNDDGKTFAELANIIEEQL